MHRRRGQPDDLVGSRVIHRTGLQLSEEFGVNRHEMERHGDRIAGGVISGRHQKAEEVLEIGEWQAPVGRDDAVQHTLRIHRLFA